MKILQDYHLRRWIYGVIAAGLALLVGYGFVSSDQTELWLRLAEAALNLVPAAALSLAAAKAKPAVSDTGDIPAVGDVDVTSPTNSSGKHGILE